jgi:hypothetical protein
MERKFTVSVINVDGIGFACQVNSNQLFNQIKVTNVILNSIHDLKTGQQLI